MFHPDIVLQHIVDLGLGQGLRQPRRLFRWKAAVDACRAHIDARLYLRGSQVRTVLGVAGEITAVETRRSYDAIRVGGRGVERPRPAHAIADGADLAVRAMRCQRIEKRAGVRDCHRLRGRTQHLAQLRAGPLVGEGGLGIERPVITETIEEIRHQHCITFAREPLRHLVERRARTECIHVEDDAGRTRIRVRHHQRGRRHAIGRLDPDLLPLHPVASTQAGRNLYRSFGKPQSVWRMALRQTSLWMMSATLARPEAGSLHVKASGMDSFFFATNAFSASSSPGSM